jgi:hypothetical protein
MELVRKIMATVAMPAEEALLATGAGVVWLMMVTMTKQRDINIAAM